MKSFRYLLAPALLISLCFSTVVRAQTPAPGDTNAPPTERFLFIVETSTTMAKRSENTAKVVASMIASGLKGQIGPRSTIGIWTFNDQLFTGKLPVQTWLPDTRQVTALTFGQFIEKQTFENSPNLSVTWPAVTNIVAKSEHITLLFVTSGYNPIVGTPYVGPIGESFRANAEAQRKNNMPFVTILRAVKGQFVGFSVTTPPWPLEVPEYPDGMKPVVVIDPPQPVVATSTPPLIIKHENLIVKGTPAPTVLASTSGPVVVSNVIVARTESTNKIAATNIAASAAAPTVKSPPATKAHGSLTALLLIGAGAGLVLLLVLVALLRMSRRAG